MALHELFTEEDNSKDIKIVVSDAQQAGEGFGKPNQGTQFKAEAMYQGKVYAGFGKWFYYIVAILNLMSTGNCDEQVFYKT